ncbi:MAG: ThuA domain-containing protein, partial [Aeoliella sp.]
VQETDEPSYFTGPEYQVFDHAGHNKKPIGATSAGALYDLYSPSEDASLPAGEWNKGKIVIDGNHLEHWLNGKRIVNAEFGSDDWNHRVQNSKFAKWPDFGKIARGHIALQDHGNPVWYRNIRIKPLVGASAAKSDAVPTRILLVSQSQGFKHSTVTRKSSDLSHTERVMTELGIRSGEFRIDCTQDVETDFTPELLKNYNLVMFYTTGKLPIPVETREWFLNEWLKQKGHGFLGVHSAADTYHDYEPYWDMIGGTFNGHPWTSNSEVVVTVHDQAHPAAAPWGEEITITDEIYQFKHWQPEKVRVLMSLNMAKTKIKKPYHVPILWVKEYGEGRVMHMSLGHREDVWENPMYQESLIGGIRWLSGNENADATPNPEVSAAEEAKAKAAAQQ